MTGAARLAADAARRAGAGMVTIAAIRGGGDVYRGRVAGLLVTEADSPNLLDDQRRQVWVCGPGLGADAARNTLPALLAAGRAWSLPTRMCSPLSPESPTLCRCGGFDTA